MQTEIFEAYTNIRTNLHLETFWIFKKDTVKVQQQQKNLNTTILRHISYLPSQILPCAIFRGDIHQHSTVYNQQGDKTLYILEAQWKLRFLASAKKPNSLITLYMYAIMSYNTILSCISNLGTPPFQSHKRQVFNGKAHPTVYKSICKSPTFLKECHHRESCKH